MESHQSSRYGCFLLLVFTFLIVLPHPVCRAQIDPHPTASSESQGVQSVSLDSLAVELQRYVDSGQIVGAEVLVIKNRHSIFHRTLGWMDREKDQPMECDTIFNIRSMTKPLISAGIQILLEEGKIRLSDRAAEYLPGFRDGNAANITIEQLLTHRSGLPLTILTCPPEKTHLIYNTALGFVKIVFKLLYGENQAVKIRGTLWPADGYYRYQEQGYAYRDMYVLRRNPEGTNHRSGQLRRDTLVSVMQSIAEAGHP